jgi:hypothetical protein
MAPIEAELLDQEAQVAEGLQERVVLVRGLLLTRVFPGAVRALLAQDSPGARKIPENLDRFHRLAEKVAAGEVGYGRIAGAEEARQWVDAQVVLPTDYRYTSLRMWGLRPNSAGLRSLRGALCATKQSEPGWAQEIASLEAGRDVALWTDPLAMTA